MSPGPEHYKARSTGYTAFSKYYSLGIKWALPYNFVLKTQNILTVLLLYIWLLDFSCFAISQTSPEQEAKGSAGPKLLRSFGEAELAKEHLDLCHGPGAEGSGESYKTVRRAVWSWVCGC